MDLFSKVFVMAPPVCSRAVTSWTRSRCGLRLLCADATLATESVHVKPLPPSPVASPSISNLPSAFNAQSYRRVDNSPTLPLEAVAVPQSVQQAVHTAINKSSLSAKTLRSSTTRLLALRSPETYNEKRVLQRGKPIVRMPQQYTEHESIAYLALRMPGALTANVYVMAEARRSRPHFLPSSMLDFGAGVGVSLMAAARSFASIDSQASIAPNASDTNARDVDSDLHTEHNSDHSNDYDSDQILREVCFVDQSSPMRKLARDIIQSDPNINPNSKIEFIASLRDSAVKSKTYDLVSASYSLNEIVRTAMAAPEKCEESPVEEVSVARDDRVKLAETRLRKTVKTLWSRTAVGGLFIVIEDGTAAGFETVSFARDLVQKLSPPIGDIQPSTEQQNADDAGSASATVPSRSAILAPCLHQRTCPLMGKITRHSICRFQQRLNRPLFSRNASPMSNGYEDEYFSYIVIQKVDVGHQAAPDDAEDKRWGRLIRAPLRKGKHVSLDACTRESKLERRVISKKNAPDGQYSKARRAKWGDVWPSEPISSPQPLNF